MALEDTWQQDMEEHRKQNFAVKAEGPDQDGEYTVSVTHNGWQWRSIYVNRAELDTLHSIIGGLINSLKEDSL